MLFYQERICADVASKTCFLDLLEKKVDTALYKYGDFTRFTRFQASDSMTTLT